MNEIKQPAIVLENLSDEKIFHSIKSTLVNKEGLSYHDFKKTLRPHYNKIAFDITIGWLAFAGCIAAGSYIEQIENIWVKIILFIADAMLLGFITSYLSNFFHEAAHYNLSNDKNRNDLLANIFLGILQAQNIKHYRLVHWQHHVHLGTTDDTEHSYFNGLNTKFFIENLFGISAIRIFLFRSGNSFLLDTEYEKTILKKQKLQMLIAGIVFHLSFLSLFILTKNYWIAGIWLLSFGSFFPFFAALRQLLEHRSELADSKSDYLRNAHGKTNRLFSNNIFSSTFGSAGFDRHLLHHLEPQISYTNLRKLEKYLSQTSLAPQLKKHKTTYLKAFISLLGK